MKKKLTPVYAIFWALLTFILFISFSSNPPNGHTGAPPTSNTCSASQGGCHTAGSGTGDVVITGLPSTITPNTMYPITVTVNRTNTVPQKGGFQMVVLDASNNNAGTLSGPGVNSTLQIESGRTYFEHNPAPNFGANDFINFTVNWTSPATGSGAITMYAAANLANGNGSSNGDNIVTTTASGMLMGGGGGVISVSTTSTNVSCFGGNNGSATANASGGGGGPYTFAWSNGANTQTASNLTVGTYTITVTNAGGGSGTASVTITQPPQLSVFIVNQVNITCSTPTGTAIAQGSGGTGSFNYAWSSGAAGATASNLTPGSYTVTVTDANNCTSTTAVNISANTTPPTAVAGPSTQITCTSPTVSLNGTGSSSGANFTYLWTTSNGQILSGANTLNPLVSAAGTYTLTVTNNSNGCAATSSTTVTNNTTAPTSNAGTDAVLTCINPQVQLNGAGSSTGINFTYSWTTANGNIVSGANTLTPTVNAAGTYCLLVTNTTNGCTNSDCAVVSQNTTPPTANAASAPSLTCSQTSITLDGSASSSGPNFTYLWSTVNGNIVGGATTTMPVVNVAGIYSLTVTNTQNGCTASVSVVVSQNTTLPTASAGPVMTINCNNNVVVLNGTGSSQGANFSYTWSGTGIQSGGNTATPTVNATGTYIITVTNTATGCTATSSTTVNLTPAPSVSISNQNNVNCNGNNTGNVTAVASGGTGTYTFAWSNGGTSATIGNLPAGTYTVTATDGDGCTATASATISQPTVLDANASATGLTSVGANDGTATANPIGGVPGYTFNWSNGGTTQTITALPAGNYTVTVTDSNNCTSAQTVTVSSFNCAGFGISLNTTHPSCQGGSNGSITANPSGGSPAYQYIWSNGANTATVSTLGAGSFTVTVIDANGCEATGNATLTAPPALNLSVAQQANVSCNGGSNGVATLSAAGGTPGYTFAWSNGGLGISQNSLQADTYTVTATDANGCTANVQVVISQPTLFAGNVTATGETAVGANNGTASATVSGGVGPYTFLWNNGATTSSILSLPPGNYCVTATDANGCTVIGCASVASFGCAGNSVQVSGTNVTCFGGSDGTALATATGFDVPVTYTWSNGSIGASVGGLLAGTYTVTVSDVNGCTGSATVSITAPQELKVVVLNLSHNPCPGQTAGTVSVDGQGGTPGYSFAWSNGSMNPTISNLASGIQVVTLTDALGCTATLQVETITEPDLTPPSVFATGLTVSLNLNGQATITAAMLDGGSFDNCGIDTMFLNRYHFDCGDLGQIMVVFTAVDAAGNQATDTANVIVVDELAPSLVCPPLITVVSPFCELEVEYPTPVALDNCGNVTVFLLAGLPSGALFPSGTTEITWGADDNYGNTVFCTFSISVTGDLTTEIIAGGPACFGFDDGEATALPSGGTPPYSYEWNDPAQQFTQTATGLAPGIYTVFVTDSEGCVTSAQVEVSQPDELFITLDQLTGVTGNNMNGAISVTVSGGTGGYFYEWLFNGAFFSNQEDLTGLGLGEYGLVVVDANGCAATEIFLVEPSTGTFDPTFQGQVTLWPNPVAEQLFLKFDLPYREWAEVRVLDFAGRSAGPARSAFVFDETLELDLSDVAPGVYLVRLVSGDKAVVKKVVVTGVR